MTENNRFIAIDEGLDLIIRDTVTGDNIIDAEGIEEILNDYEKENEQLKQALLFFVDVANAQCSSNWLKDMEKCCKRFFNCTYEEAKEKYGDYDGSWWEIE